MFLPVVRERSARGGGYGLLVYGELLCHRTDIAVQACNGNLSGSSFHVVLVAHFVICTLGKHPAVAGSRDARRACRAAVRVFVLRKRNVGCRQGTALSYLDAILLVTQGSIVHDFDIEPSVDIRIASVPCCPGVGVATVRILPMRRINLSIASKNARCNLLSINRVNLDFVLRMPVACLELEPVILEAVCAYGVVKRAGITLTKR